MRSAASALAREESIEVLVVQTAAITLSSFFFFCRAMPRTAESWSRS